MNNLYFYYLKQILNYINIEPSFKFRIKLKNDKNYINISLLNKNKIKKIDLKQIDDIKINNKNFKKILNYLKENKILNNKKQIIYFYLNFNNLENINFKNINNFVLLKNGNILKIELSKHAIVQIIKRLIVFQYVYKNHNNYKTKLDQVIKELKKYITDFNNFNVKKVNEIIITELIDNSEVLKPERTFYRKSDQIHNKIRKNKYKDEGKVIKLYLYPFLFLYNTQNYKIITAELYSSNLPNLYGLNKYVSISKKISNLEEFIKYMKKYIDKETGIIKTKFLKIEQEINQQQIF